MFKLVMYFLGLFISLKIVEALYGDRENLNILYLINALAYTVPFLVTWLKDKLS